MTENLAHIHPQLQSLAIEVDALTPDPKNARKHDRRNIDAIKASLSKFGFRAALVAQRVGDSLIVRAGNGRLQAARELGFTHVPVLVFDEGDDEAVAYAIADNRTAELAEWDFDVLADSLQTLGKDDLIGWSETELLNLLTVNSFEAPSELQEVEKGVVRDSDKENIYTKKIKGPVYVPTSEVCPNPSTLYNTTKTDELRAQVLSAGLPDDVRDFLLAAASRHTVFNYRQIAEFYAHADAKTQKMMENSALVIIDYDDAVANGFVAVTKDLAALFSEKFDNEESNS